MTHTLHRQGTENSLKEDFVVFAMPSSGLNSKDSKPKLEKCFDILKKHDPVNIGDSKNGSKYSLGSEEAVREAIVENELVHAVYNTRDKLKTVLKDLKKANLGLSITVSGLIDHVEECCGEIDLKKHTINNSLGIWGKKELLPEKKVQEISTMCGHGLVSFNLVNDLIDKVKNGEITAKEAGNKLAKPCICGVFNPERATKLIEEMM